MRINKLLADYGVGSRRKIDQLITEGKVEVNGIRASLGMMINPEADKIVVEGKSVNLKQKPEYEYWKIYKPVGMVSTTSDPEGRPTVLSLLNKTASTARVYPVGRLDIESEGLMLLTSDGQLAQKLTHPKYQTPKEYLVWANGSLSNRDLSKLQKGVKLSDGVTAPARVELIFREEDRVKVSITLTEGRNRQIRRMMAKVGLMVTRLKRVKLGAVELGDMYEGEVRKITINEISQLSK